MDMADFRHYFATIHKETTPTGEKRILYSHVTAVSNPRSIRSILDTRESSL
jgi:hypothetical protein